MGLGPGAVKLYLELWQRNLLANVESVIDMGSQELHLTRTAFKELVNAAGIPGYEEKAFPNLDNWPGQPRCSARYFYELLGAKEYACIDMNGMHHSVPHDLNTPLRDESLLGRYDMVNDHCSNSHAFNVGESYRTIHRLCKPGGLITLMTPVYGSNGYFNFDLSFYEGMAAANGYRILFSSFLLTLDKQFLTPEERRTQPAALNTLYDEYHIPLSNDLLATVNWSKDHATVGICYVFQKQSDEEFRFPYQGDFMPQVYGNHGYQLQFLPTPPSRTYIPVVTDMKGGLLESFSVKTLARHVLRRVGRRMTAKK